MTITEKNLADALAATHDVHPDGFTAVARKAAQLLGVDLAREPKPEPGSWWIHKPTGVPARMMMYGGTSMAHFTDEGMSAEVLPDDWEHHYEPARITRTTAAPVTLTEDQALALRAEVDPANRSVPALPRELATKFANAVLAQYAAPAEDMPDWDDVRNAVASERGNGWALNDAAINGITDAVMRLLHREDQP